MKVTIWENHVENDGLEYPVYNEIDSNDKKDYDLFYEGLTNRVVNLNLQGNNLTRAMREKLHDFNGEINYVIFNRSSNSFTLYSLITREFKKYSR